jgi:predicted enzyme related to lactoylglutathione lyase
VLGWEFAPGHDPRGRLVPGSVPPQGLWGGQPRSTLFCSYVVADVAATVSRVSAAGGRAGELVRQPYGLTADCLDDQGGRFAVHQPAEPGPAAGRAPAAARDGDLAYITLEVPDGARARDFYAAVLGWQIGPGRVPDGWQVTGTAPLIGISGGHAEVTGVPLWRVSDAVAAAGRVRAAGGTAGEPQREPYGLVAGCTDGQGTRFALCQFPGQP